MSLVAIRSRVLWAGPALLVWIALSSSAHSQVPAGALAVARFTAAGELDPLFGTGGRAVVPLQFAGFRTAGVAADAASRITLSGTAQGPDGDTIVLARLTAEGALDPSFGIGGVVVQDFPVITETVEAFALDRHGRIVIAGHTCCINDRPQIIVGRFLPDGRLDESFGAFGFLLGSFSLSSDDDIPAAVAIDAMDRIVVAGTAVIGGNELVGLLRLLDSGLRDQSFGRDGRVVNDSFGVAGARAVAIDARGRIAVAGAAIVPEPDGAYPIFAVLRFGPRGAIDPFFGTLGAAFTDFPDTVQDTPYALLAAGDGLIAAGSSFALSSKPHESSKRYDLQGFVAVARYTLFGKPDRSFGGTGTVLTRWPAKRGIGRVAAELDSFGRVVTAATLTDFTTLESFLAVARYLPDGTLDRSFGKHGRALTSFGATFHRVAGTTLDPLGRVVVGGDVAPVLP